MKTKYSIVKEFVLSKIQDETYQPHDKISSESELMKHFGVSRHTVRLAIGDLVTEGWLYSEQGSGTFCAEKKSVSKVNKSKNIAIVVTYISDYIFPSIIRGAEKQLSEKGYQVSLFSTNNDHNLERKILKQIIHQNFEGVIIEPTRSALANPNINYYLDLESKGIPYVMINAFYEELEPFSITIDDEKGGYMQAEHLIGLGHKNIIGIFKNDDLQGIKRMKGFIKAHRDNGLTVKSNNIITFTSDNRTIRPSDALREILELPNRPTAIASYNDQIAIMLLDVIREKNLQIPEDISIIGYDDSYLADISEVKLTTVKHPKSDMGISAGEIILQLAEQRNKKQSKNKVESLVYQPELIIRESTKKI